MQRMQLKFSLKRHLCAKAGTLLDLVLLPDVCINVNDFLISCIKIAFKILNQATFSS